MESDTIIDFQRIYPVKACAPVKQHDVDVLQSGFRDDRLWGIFDANGNFASQRKPGYRQLALVQTEMNADGSVRLRMGSEFMDTLPDDESGEPVEVQVQGDACQAEQDVVASEFLSRVLGQDCFIARKKGPRLVNRKDAPEDAQVNWQDRYPILGISYQTIVKLQGLLGSAGLEESIEELMDRFRPNIIFHAQNPHDENRMARIQIGDAILRGVRPCERCNVPNVHQQTADYNDLVWDVLMAHFKGTNKMPVLGENFVVERGGNIQSGNVVKILETHEDGVSRGYIPLAQNKRP